MPGADKLDCLHIGHVHVIILVSAARKIGEKLHISNNRVVVSRKGHGITQAAP